MEPDRTAATNVVATPEEAEWLRKYFQELVDLRRDNQRLRSLLHRLYGEIAQTLVLRNDRQVEP